MTAASDSISQKIHSGPLLSSSKVKLNEKDLLKMCVDSPQYLSKALGHDADAEGTGLQTLQ